MSNVFWRGVKGGSPGARIFALYLAVTLIVAMAAPALAVAASPIDAVLDGGAVGDPSAAPAPEAPAPEAPAPEAPAPEAPAPEAPAPEAPAPEAPAPEAPAAEAPAPEAPAPE